MAGGVTAIRLDNPFMVSIRTAGTLTGDVGAGITVNGGMRTTVEGQNKGGGWDGIRLSGIDHMLFASRYEVQQNAGINVGVDADGNPAPMIGASIAGIQQEANAIGIKVTRCDNCLFSAVLIYGHALELAQGPAPDYYGLYVDEGLESENAKLKKPLADTLLDNAALKDLLAKKW